MFIPTYVSFNDTKKQISKSKNQPKEAEISNLSIRKIVIYIRIDIVADIC